MAFSRGKRWLLGLAGGAAVLGTAAALSLSARQAEPVPSPAVQSAELPSREVSESEVLPVRQPYCSLGVWQGQVAVLDPGSGQPREVLETPVRALPPADQAALTRGIPIYTPAELAARLEDYGP